MRNYRITHDPIATISFHYEVRYLGAILALVKQAGKTRGLSLSKNYALENATEEVLELVNRYADASRKELVTLSLFEITKGIGVCVKDVGQPAHIVLDPEKAIEEDDFTIILLAGMTDVLECKNLGLEGREFYFEIHLEQEQLASERVKPEKLDQTGLQVIDTSNWGPEDFKIRMINPEDAIEVTSCIYSAYGYTYARDIVYYPDQFYKLHNDGKLQCAVLETPDGQVASTIIIDRDTGFPGACELLGLATKKEYKRLGITKLLFDFIIKEEIKNNKELVSIFGEAVTNHPYSQKTCEGEGFIPTGIFFGLVPDAVKFTDFSVQEKDRVAPRISVIYYVKQIAPWQEKTLFVAKKDQEVVRNIFDQLNQPVQLNTTATKPTTDKSIVSTTFVDKLDIGLLKISTLGEDIQKLVQTETVRLKSMGAKVIVAYLDMLDESAVWATDELAAVDFDFTGVLPGNDTFQPMMLQYFSGLVFDSKQIVIENRVGREILEHVRKYDKSMSFS